MSFNTQRLVNNRVLVSGTDVFGTEGRVTVDSSQWDDIKGNQKYDQAMDAFDDAVESFFAPLVEAAEKANEAGKVEQPTDSASYVVLNEAVEGVDAVSATLVHLNDDSIVLRLIEQDETDRLIWVDDKLEVLAAVDTSTPVVSDSY